MPSTPITDAAKKYIEKGWATVPLNGKAPNIKTWNELSIKLDEVERYWNNGQNVGVILGEISGGLTDIDLDCNEAVVIAPVILGDLNLCRFGRDGEITHGLCICADATPYKIDDPQRSAEKKELAEVDKEAAKKIKTALIEIRSTGNQTMFPPSIHPETGSTLRFEDATPPPEVEHGLLKRRIELTAAASLIGRYWPEPGKRRTTAMALCGMLVRAEGRYISVDETDLLWAGLCRWVEHIDEEWKDRRKLLKRTRRRDDANKDNTGQNWLRENEAFPEDVLNLVLDLLGIVSEGSGSFCPLYDDIKGGFSKKHVVVDWAGKPIIMSEAYNPRHQRFYWKYRSFGEFRSLLINKKAAYLNGQRERVEVPLAEMYLRDPERTTYEGVYLSADDYGAGDYLNLWRGFAVEPKPGDWSLFKEHIWENVCCKEQELYDYLIKWMAWKVQNPDRVPGVAIVLRGDKGVGKNKVAETFGKLFGQHYFQTEQQEQIMGRFGDHLIDCCILTADEAFWAGDKKHEGILKGLITSEERSVEGKGLKSVMADNHVGLFILSNAEYVVPATEGERRFAVYDVGNAHQKDYPYFEAIDQQMGGGGRQALLYDLMNTDLTSFQIRQAPNSEGLVKQKLANAEPFMQWVVECLISESVVADRSTLRLAESIEDGGASVYDWPVYDRLEIEKKKFFSAYFLWRNERGYRSQAEDIRSLGAKVSNWIGGDVGNRNTTKRITINGKQRYVFVLPGVDTARKLIEEHYEGEIEWPK